MTRLIFDKYEVIRRLAIGGMGEIFLARQHGISGFDRLVILKSLLPELAESNDAVDQFLDEARVAATLNHPNIVSIFEVGLWDGIYFIAMEYIEGENVAVLVKAVREKNQNLPFSVTARIIHDAAIGLDHAHHARDTSGRPLTIVHRDVSPQNIMVRADGVTKVVDFGVAKAANRSTRTATGVLKGKIRYMPPEQITGGSLDGRSDQFSLGVVMWEMITGQRLFHKSENDADTMRRMLSEQIPAPSSLMANVPPELESAVTKMLSRDRNARYPRCRDVAADLRRYLERASKDLGEAQVAGFITRTLGAKIKDRTSDLTPSQENFFISLTPTQSGRATVIPEGAVVPNETTGATVPVRAPSNISATLSKPEPPAPAKTKLMIAAAFALFAIAAMIGTVLFKLGPKPESEVVRAVVPPASPVENAVPAPVVTFDRASIDVREPAGSIISIDGVARKERAPMLFADLTPGEHEVKLELAGYDPIVKRLTLRAGDTVTVREYATAIPPVLSLASDPPGATVRAGSLLLGTTPLDIKTLAHGVKHQLYVEKTGYEAKTIVVELAAGQRKNERVALEKQQRAANTRRQAERPVVAAAQPAPTPAVQPLAAADTNGFLTVKTTPWTKVTIEGKPHGATPVFKVALSAGKHEIRLTNETAQIDVVRTVIIKGGETTKLDLELGK